VTGVLTCLFRSFGGGVAMGSLKNYYEYTKSTLKTISIPEKLLCDFFLNQKEIEVRPQIGSEITTDIYLPKYSPEVFEKVSMMYSAYLQSPH
jgi:hypothetical protein